MNFAKEIVEVELRFDNITHEDYSKLDSYGSNPTVIANFLSEKDEDGNSFYLKSSRQQYLKTESFKDFVTLSNPTLKSGDKVYFCPKTNVPRYKFKEKGEEVGFKTKRDIEKSNIVVIDEQSFVEMTHKNYRYYGSGRSYHYYSLENFEKILNLVNLKLEEVLLEEDLEFLQNKTFEERAVLLNHKAFNLFNRIVGYSPSNSDYDTLHSYSHFSNIKIEDCRNPKLIGDLQKFADRGGKFISSQEVLNQINNNLKLTDKLISRLNQMLGSDDESSVALAMETISNLDFSGKFFDLIKLLNSNNKKIYFNKAFNHINFKSFRKVLDEKLNRGRDYIFEHPFNYYDYINVLGPIKEFRKEHLDLLIDDIYNDFKNTQAGMFFNVEKISLKENIVKMIKESEENYESLKEKDVEN